MSAGSLLSVINTRACAGLVNTFEQRGHCELNVGVEQTPRGLSRPRPPWRRGTRAPCAPHGLFLRLSPPREKGFVKISRERKAQSQTRRSREPAEAPRRPIYGTPSAPIAIRSEAPPHHLVALIGFEMLKYQEESSLESARIKGLRP